MVLFSVLRAQSFVVMMMMICRALLQGGVRPFCVSPPSFSPSLLQSPSPSVPFISGAGNTGGDPERDGSFAGKKKPGNIWRKPQMLPEGAAEGRQGGKAPGIRFERKSPGSHAENRNGSESHLEKVPLKEIPKSFGKALGKAPGKVPACSSKDSCFVEVPENSGMSGAARLQSV